MSNKSEAVSTVFAVLKAIDRNNAMSTMICDYLISSPEEKEHFGVEARTFIDRCKLEADQLKKQLRSKTFSSFDQLNKLLADLLYQNHDLRQKVLNIKADIVNMESNRGATEDRATCPVNVIYGDFPDLLKKQQTGSQPLTVLCDVLMDRYNLNNDPWVSKALTNLENAYRTKLEKAYQTKLEKKGGKSTLNSQVYTTDTAEKEKMPTRMVITPCIAGVANKAHESAKVALVCNVSSEPLASTSANCQVMISKEMRNPKLTTSVATIESRKPKPITEPGDQMLAPLTVSPVIASNESKRVKSLSQSCDQVKAPLAVDKLIIPANEPRRPKPITSPCDQDMVPAVDKPIKPANESRRIKPITLSCDQGMVPPAADKPIIPVNVSRRPEPISPSCDQDMVPPAVDKPIIPANESGRIKGIPLLCDRELTPLAVTPVDSLVISAKGPRKLKPNTSVAAEVIAESEAAENGTPTDPLSVSQILSLIDSIASVAKESSKPKDLTLGVTNEPEGLINGTTSVDLVPAPLTTTPVEFKVPVVKENRRFIQTTSLSGELTSGSIASTKVTSNDTPAGNLVSAQLVTSPGEFKVPVIKENKRLKHTTSVSVGASTGSKTSTKVISKVIPAGDLVSMAHTIPQAEFKVHVDKKNRRLMPTTSVSEGTATGSKTSTNVTSGDIQAAEIKSPVVPVKEARRLTPTTSVSVGTATGSKTSTVTSNDTHTVDLIPAPLTISPAEFKVHVAKKNRRLASTASVSIEASAGSTTSTEVTCKVTTASDLVSMTPTIPPANRTVVAPKEDRKLKSTASTTLRTKMRIQPCIPVTDTRVVALDSRHVMGESLEVTTINLALDNKLPETVRQETFDTLPRKVIINKITETRSVGHSTPLRSSTTPAAGHPVTYAMAARLGPSKAMRDDLSGQASNLVSAPITMTWANSTVSLTKEAKLLEHLTFDTRRVNVLDNLSPQDNSNILRKIKQAYRTPLTFDPLPLKVIVNKVTTTLPQGYLCTSRENNKERQGTLMEQLSAKSVCTQKMDGLIAKKIVSPRPVSEDIPPAERRLMNSCLECQISLSTSTLTTGRLAGCKRQAKSWEFSSIPPAKRRCVSVQSVLRPGGLAGRKRSAKGLEGLTVPPVKRRRISVKPKKPTGHWSFECGGWTYRKRSC